MAHLVEGSYYEMLHCGQCGISFLAPHGWVMDRRDRGGFGREFVCPNGHTRVWSGETEADRMRRERDLAIQQKARIQDELNEAQRLKDAAERKAKRIEKRARAAMCPCCNRHFSNVEAHIKKQHPEIAVLPKKVAPLP